MFQHRGAWAVNGFGPEGRAPSEGSVGESKWPLSKKAGVGKCKGGSEGSLFHVSKQETSSSQMSMAERSGKLSSQRAGGRHAVQGAPSPLRDLRPRSPAFSADYMTPALCCCPKWGGGEHPEPEQGNPGVTPRARREIALLPAGHAERRGKGLLQHRQPPGIHLVRGDTAVIKSSQVVGVTVRVNGSCARAGKGRLM